MSVQKARASWAQLSEGERNFVHAPKLSGSMPATDWIAQIEGITQFDEHVNVAVDQLWKIGMLLLVGAFCAIFGAFVLAGGVPIVSGVALIVGTLAGLSGFSVFVYRSSWKSVDVPDVLCETVLPLLRVMELELPAESCVRLTLDLTGSEQAEKTFDTAESGSWMSLPHRRDTIYRDPWLGLQATLIDGSRLQFALRDTLRVRKVTKISRSGKRKTKTKRKVKRRIRVCLSVRPDRGLMGEQAEGVVVRVTPKRHHIIADRLEQDTETLFSSNPAMVVRLAAQCFLQARTTAA